MATASMFRDFQSHQRLNHWLPALSGMPVFMNSKTAIMKKLHLIITFVFLAAGCAFQQPDYLKVVTVPELSQIMQREDIFLVDVHTPEQRHIKSTDLFIPYDQIEKYKDQLPKDKNSAIYLYCESGPMGNVAARSLHELGYRNLINLEGGAKAWRKAGLDFE